MTVLFYFSLERMEQQCFRFYLFAADNRAYLQVVARLRASSRSVADAGLVHYVIQPSATPGTPQ